MSSNASTHTRTARPIMDLVKTVQFWWFVGQLASMVGTTFYFFLQLGFFKSSRMLVFWYRESLFATLCTFSIILYNVYSPSNRNLGFSVLHNENVQYLVITILWLVTKPFLLALIPFFVFSCIHVMNYLRHTLLPFLGYNAESPLVMRLGSLSDATNSSGLMFASTAEFLTLVTLVVNLITFRKGSILPFVIYFVVFKLRYDASPATRQVVRNSEVQIDSLLSRPQIPVAIKQGWVAFKSFVRQGAGYINIPGGSSSTAQPASSSQHDKNQ